MRGLTVEQMSFLVSKGVTAEEMLAFAQMGQTKSKGAERTARWRSRKKPVERMPEVEWLPLAGEIVRRDGGKCTYCGATENLGADHIVPLSRGGSNEPSNLTACCESCNKSKGGRTVEEWKSGSSARHGDVTVTRNRDASHPPYDIYSNPPVSSDEETIPPVRRVKGSLAKPEGVSDPVWMDFQALRKAKRAPLGETALAAIRREAEKAGWTMEAALSECLARGWQAFKADWVQPDPRQGKPPGGGGDDFLSHLVAKRQREQAR